MVRIIVFLILFPTNSIAKDFLFDAMVKSWSEESKEPEPVEEEYYDENGQEFYSWDNLYLDPYAETEIIYDY